MKPAFEHDLLKTILDADKEQARKTIEKAIAEHMAPLEIMNTISHCLSKIGALWEEGEIFLPELVSSADVVIEIMPLIKPALLKSNAEGKTSFSRKTAVIGTVQGDIHDIGKSLVGTMLMAKGFDVVDLGVDTSPLTFVEAVKKHNASLVGISALLTTTMIAQKDVVNMLKEQGLRDQVKILVGGAPVTDSWAQEIGADGTARDAMSAAELAFNLMK